MMNKDIGEGLGCLLMFIGAAIFLLVCIGSCRIYNDKPFFPTSESLPAEKKG